MAAINRYNFLRWFVNESANVWNSIFQSDFSQWVEDPLKGLQPLGMTVIPENNLNEVVQDNNQMRINFTHHPSYSLAVRLPLSQPLTNGTYRVSFDLLEISGIILTVTDPLFVSHDYIATGSISFEFVINNNVIVYNIEFGSTVPEGVTGTVLIDNFKLELFSTGISIADDELDFPKYFPHRKGRYCPYLVPGDQTAFYINSIIAYPNDLSLKLIDANTAAVVQDNLGTLNKLEFVEGYNLWAQFINPNVAHGFYRFGLFDGLTLIYASNVLFGTNKDYEDKTIRIKYRHNKNRFGYMYDLIPEFYHQFRLTILEIDEQTDYNIDQYRSVTSGKLRNLNGITDKYYKFESHYFDDFAHEAASVMLEHSDLYINNEKFTFKQGYKIVTDQSERVSKAEFELWRDKFISDKRTNPTIIPPELIFLDKFNTADLSNYNFGSFTTGAIVSETLKVNNIYDSVNVGRFYRVFTQLAPGTYRFSFDIIESFNTTTSSFNVYLCSDVDSVLRTLMQLSPDAFGTQTANFTINNLPGPPSVMIQFMPGWLFNANAYVIIDNVKLEKLS